MSDQITTALEQVAANPLPAPRDPEFRMVVRGYDREEVDAYLARLRAELERERDHQSPSGAVKRALEQVGEEVADILKRAHETAAEVTSSSRREADERLEGARRAAEARIVEANVRASELTAGAEARVRELDLDTDRIWAERDRIVADMRDLARQLTDLADVAAERFPAEDLAEDADETTEIVDAEPIRELGINGDGPGPAGPVGPA
jgi:DivIVA domain-containing protein